jgi:ASC-1-like (ASCH) protein
LEKKISEADLGVLKESGRLTSREVRFFRRRVGVTVEVLKRIRNFQTMLRKKDFHNYPEWKENFERVFKIYWRNDSHILMAS